MVSSPLINGLQAFYKLSDTSDSSGNNRTLTNNGNVSFASGKIGNAAVFDGSNWLTSENISVSFENGITFSAWVKITNDQVSDNCFFATFTSDGANGFYGGIIGNNRGGSWNGQPFADMGHGLANFSLDENNTLRVQPNTWTFVTFVCDNTNWSAWVNGDKVTFSTPGNINASPITYLHIGSGLENVALLNGELDAVGIWNRALSDAEVAELYNNGTGLELDASNGPSILLKKRGETVIEHNGVRTLAGGGTGAATAAAARTNLGLGNVDNTSDAAKPISNATQTALNGKQAAGSYAPASGIAPTAITGTAVINSDSRLSNSRTPTSHKSSHATGGADALTPEDIGAEPTITTLPISQGGTGSTTAAAARDALGAKSPQIDIYTGSTTWTKPIGAKQVVIECVSGGGGGGYGGKGAAGTALYGGAGGGSGGYSRVAIDASELTEASYTVTVGIGGAGGNGSTLTNAGLGTFTRFAGAIQGQLAGANSGATVAGNGGAALPSNGSGGSPTANSGGASSITTTGGSGTGSGFAPTSGGAGGGLTAAAVVGSSTGIFGGGSGGNNAIVGLQSAGGAASSVANGVSATATAARTLSSLVINGCGGAGGGACSFATGSGGNGSNGTGYGSGGGGGGSTIGSGDRSNGGNGAPGVMVITTYF